jgi:hypothetical protein
MRPVSVRQASFCCNEAAALTGVDCCKDPLSDGLSLTRKTIYFNDMLQFTAAHTLLAYLKLHTAPLATSVPVQIPTMKRRFRAAYALA